MNYSPRFSFSRRNFGRFLTLGLLSTAFLVPVHAAAAPVAATAEVETAFTGFVHAWQTKDVNAAVGAFAPDAVAYDSTPPGKYGNPAEIREWIVGTFKALDRIAIPVSEVKIHTAGSVAWLTAHYVFKAEAGGKSSADDGNVSIVWVKQTDGSYKISVFHASNQAVAPPANVKVSVSGN